MRGMGEEKWSNQENQEKQKQQNWQVNQSMSVRDCKEKGSILVSRFNPQFLLFQNFMQRSCSNFTS